jgi:hypothetical protein
MRRLERRALVAEFATQPVGLDVVDEGALAVDLHHGHPFAVLRLERVVAGDVDFAIRNALRGEDAARPLAEVAAARGVEDDTRPVAGRFRAQG